MYAFSVKVVPKNGIPCNSLKINTYAFENEKVKE